MALDEFEAEIGLLLSQINKQPEDARELYLQLRERLNELRAMNMQVPDDLLRMEKQLEAEFAPKES